MAVRTGRLNASALPSTNAATVRAVAYRGVVPDRTARAATESLPRAGEMISPVLRAAVLAWYEAHGRRLPFRATSDPYAILVSEAMAQQTQAERAGEAWARFMNVYPTAPALAAATPADVLRAWQGLGYNRRALNLWRAARRIVDVHGGHVPADLDALQAMPGVGPYTARAVAAIAFGLPVGAVDTNVRRVLGRIVGGQAGIRRPADVQAIADAAVPPDRPGAWTHALMDLGATVCRPRDPDCAGCPVRSWCRYATERRTGQRVPGVATVAVGRGPGSGRAIRGSGAPFPATSRWLRGRIVDHLRAAEPGAWLVVEAPIGSHGELAVAAALDALAHEGLVELAAVEDMPNSRRARLPLR
jgi:A/G-specific adenine glycosylase